MNTVDKNTIQTMKRPALQRLAKENGVRAVGPDEHIRMALLKWLADNASTSDVPAAVDSGSVEILQDVKNLAHEGRDEVKLTGTRKSTRLTVTKSTSSKTVGEKANDKVHHVAGNKSPRGVLAPLPQSLGSEELIVEFDAALTLLRLSAKAVLRSEPSAVNLGPKKRKHSLEVDGAERPSAAMVRPRQKRRRTQV